MKKIIASITICTVLSACATSVQQQILVPLVDMKGVDNIQFNNDVMECNAYARRIDAEQHAANTAMALGVLGALLGASLGNRRDALQLGAIGAASGAVQGHSKAVEKQEDVVRRCLAGRGYVVLE